MAVRDPARGILDGYAGHVQRTAGYRRIRGSNWTSAMAVEHLAKYRHAAARGLYELGRDQATVHQLLAEIEQPLAALPSPTTSNQVNDMIRRVHRGEQPAAGESMNDFIRRTIGRNP